MINIGDLAVYRSGRKKDADKVVEVDSMTECRVRVVERIEGGAYRMFNVSPAKLTKLSGGLLEGGDLATGAH